MTKLFDSEGVNETGGKEMTTAVVTLIESVWLTVFVGRGNGLEGLLTARTVHLFSISRINRQQLGRRIRSWRQRRHKHMTLLA